MGDEPYLITKTLDPDLIHTYELTQYFLPNYKSQLANQGRQDIHLSQARNYILGKPRGVESSAKKQKELFAQKPLCFYTTGFRKAWENKVRSILRESIFSDVGLEYIDGADYHPDSQEIGESVRKLMQEVEFFIVEFSTFNVNVAFEMGLAIAIGRRIYAIKNEKVSEEDIDIKPSKEYQLLFDSIKQEYYKFEYSDEYPKAPPKKEHIDSLTKAIFTCSEHYRSLPKEKTRNFNPFDNTQRLIPLSNIETTVFLYFPPGSSSTKWRSDIEDELRKGDLGNPYPLRTDMYKGLELKIMSLLKAICRSSHCVIDTSGEDQYSSLLLGFAMGIKGPEILHVFDHAKPGLFTNWKGWPYYEYDTKEKLWNLIKEFIQRA